MCNDYIKQILVILFSLALVKSSVNDPRYAHTSAILNNRLYIIGGLTQTRQTGSNDVFYLDLSKPFDISNPQWIDITKTSTSLASSWANAAVLGNDVILLFEGNTWDMNSGTPERGENSLYLFNVSSQLWTVPAVNGTSPARRRELNIVSDDVNSEIYIYGGARLDDNENNEWFNDMYILHTFEFRFSWESVQMSDAPPFSRVDYTATMLPKGDIVYIGGRIRFVENGIRNQMEANMAQINVYNTKEAKWYLMATGGEVIENRFGHSAVLTSDGRIIIYGGAKGNPAITASPDLAVLNTNTTTYQWSVPQASSQLPPSLAFHTANIYNDYMFVAFGNITNGATSTLEMSSGIYILDTNAYTWITSYNSTTVPPDSNHDSFGLIMGLASAGLVVIVVLSILGVLLYKRCKKDKKETSGVIPTPGTSEFETTRGDDGEDGTQVRGSIITTNSSNYDNYRNSAIADDSSLIRPDSNSFNPKTTSHVPHVSYTGIGGVAPDRPPNGSR